MCRRKQSTQDSQEKARGHIHAAYKSFSIKKEKREHNRCTAAQQTPNSQPCRFCSQPARTPNQKGANPIITLLLHLHVTLLSQILQQITPLEVLVRVNNSLELIRRHDALILGLFNLSFMEVLKHPVNNLMVSNRLGNSPIREPTYLLQAMWYF